MIKSNYVEIQQHLNNKEEFTGSSSRGVRKVLKYKVYSYSTLILEYNLITQEVDFFNNVKYSPTTSKLQNMIKMAFNIKEEVQK